MTLPPVRDRPSPNHGPRPGNGVVDMLVLHYTGMADAAAALDRLCDPAAEVSAHYLIERDGTVHRMVAEDRRAWHAGRSWWQGTTDVNGRSIGIELENPGHDWGYLPFPEPQMAALEALAAAILGRHPIPAHRVVGHSDVAPRRKIDPGELFDWPRLARAGIGRWPPALDGGDGRAPDPQEALRLLGLVGYELDDPAATVAAFQRRWRPVRVDGQLDRETRRRIAVLARQDD